MTEHNQYDSYVGSLRKQVWTCLDKNPLLSPKELARLIGVSYKQSRQTLTNYRSLWKYNHQNERGSNPSNSHNCKYLGLIKEGEVRRADAANKGWVLSKARNRFLVYHDHNRLGRIAWYETGLLVLNVRPVANEGKAKTLFCNGFFNTGLISDVKVLNECVNRVHVHSGHTPFATSQRLPKTTITAFADSHGITIKLGDRSHPNCVEVLWEVTNFQEKVMSFMDRMVEGLNGQGSNGKDVGKENIGVV